MIKGMPLRSFREVIRELAKKYNMPFETVESIVIDWVKILYESVKDED